ISTGQPVIALFAVKPTSSILIPRQTVDKNGNETEVSTKGRHDPCVGIRAVPIGEAMVAIVLADHYLRHRAQTGKGQAPRASRNRIRPSPLRHRRGPHRFPRCFHCGAQVQLSAIAAVLKSDRITATLTRRKLRSFMLLTPVRPGFRPTSQPAMVVLF